PLQTNVTNEETHDTTFDFEDTKGLFSSVTTVKLLRSAANLNLAAVEQVVDLGMWVMRSKEIEIGLLEDVVLGTIKSTSYEHFVADADMEETGQTMKKLWESRLRGMLDYRLEHTVDNESCNLNANQFVNTVEATQSLPPTFVSSYENEHNLHSNVSDRGQVCRCFVVAARMIPEASVAVYGFC
ncbi:proline dehydrogenase, partial [Tanacetum coccineum]